MLNKNLYEKYGNLIFRIFIGIAMLLGVTYLAMIFLGLEDIV